MRLSLKNWKDLPAKRYVSGLPMTGLRATRTLSRFCTPGETNEDLIRLIQAFVGKSYSHGMSDYVGRVNLKINLKSVAEFISVEKLVPRVRTILGSNEFQNLPTDSQRALQTFIDATEGKVEEW